MINLYYEKGEHILTYNDVVISIFNVKPTTIMVQDAIYRRQCEDRSR